MSNILAFDPGFGNIKLYGEQGPLVMQSAVAVGGSQRVGRIEGIRVSRQALPVQTRSGSFLVGEGAHDWGRPVENLDFDRFTGTPEMMALFYGALSQYQAEDMTRSMIVGLPVAVSIGEESGHVKRRLRQAFVGDHEWSTNSQERHLIVEKVSITSQPVGALFDYLLDDEGKMIPSRSRAAEGEIAILGIGMNTVDLLVVRKGALVNRFTSGETLGVRRLIELARQSSDYSLAELDARIRHNDLDLADAQFVWERDVLGLVERRWGNAIKRFSVVVAVGGGALLMRKMLLRRLRDKLYMPNDPIIATARGLFRYARMTAGGSNG